MRLTTGGLLQERNMLDNESKALHFYNEKFRELVNGKAQRHGGRDDSFFDYIKCALKLNNPEDWFFICSSMDIVNDSLLGIENFIRFGMDGPTRYDDLGEKYIRLYGALNATYIQQQAILNLHRISNTPDLTLAERKVNALSIRDARHKLGAHSVDYENRQTSKIESFVPVRLTLGGMRCEYFNNNTLSSSSIDLSAALLEHLSLMNDMYCSIYEKFAKTIYKSNNEKYEKLIDELSTGKVFRSGGIVIRNENGERIFVTSFVEA